MFRKALLPALAAVMLSACATDYSYRNGNGDYYYGRPQVEYRQMGGYGGYGGYGGFSGYGVYGGVGYGGYSSYPGYGAYGYGGGYSRPTWYYDRFGRLVYGYGHQVHGHPYGAYGTPYSRGYWQQRGRQPNRGGHRHVDGRNAGGANDSDIDNDSGPQWRNFNGGMQPGMPNVRVQRSDDGGTGRQPSPMMEPAMPSERSSRARAPLERMEMGSQGEARALRVQSPTSAMDSAEE